MIAQIIKIFKILTVKFNSSDKVGYTNNKFSCVYTNGYCHEVKSKSNGSKDERMKVKHCS
jgi:hypothetical protein